MRSCYWQSFSPRPENAGRNAYRLPTTRMAHAGCSADDLRRLPAGHLLLYRPATVCIGTLVEHIGLLVWLATTRDHSRPPHTVSPIQRDVGFIAVILVDPLHRLSRNASAPSSSRRPPSDPGCLRP